jgi:hypothetical protein
MGKKMSIPTLNEEIEINNKVWNIVFYANEKNADEYCVVCPELGIKHIVETIKEGISIMEKEIILKERTEG